MSSRSFRWRLLSRPPRRRRFKQRPSSRQSCRAVCECAVARTSHHVCHTPGGVLRLHSHFGSVRACRCCRLVEPFFWSFLGRPVGRFIGLSFGPRPLSGTVPWVAVGPRKRVCLSAGASLGSVRSLGWRGVRLAPALLGLAVLPPCACLGLPCPTSSGGPWLSWLCRGQRGVTLTIKQK